MRPEHYASAEAFRAKVLELAERAVAGLDDAPRLLAYPEAIGLPLLLLLDEAPAAGLAAALRGLARRHGRAALAAALRHRAGPLRALYAARGPAVHRAYADAFRAAARAAGATVVAGSAFLPRVEEEPSRGLHVADARPANVSYVFSPLGGELARIPKAALTPGAESRAGLRRARREELEPVETPLGRVGVAICLDGFYESVVARYDGLGCRVLVQPSANHAPWDRPWPPDPSLREGEAWLRYGLRARLQGRLHLRYGVNPMLVGEVLGLRPRGRSSIVADAAHRPDARAEGWDGVVALAASADAEEIVRATVTLPPLAARPAQESRT